MASIRNVTKLDPFRSPELRAQFIARYDAELDGWPVPSEERDVDTDFGATHVIVTGPAAAPPLVLLHGAATTAAMWGPIIGPLSDSHRCYCIDTITESTKSVATKPVREVGDYVTWLRGTFAGLGIESARVAGLSYGGWLAALLAVNAPDVVNRLVLLSPAGTLDRIAPRWMFRMVPATFLRSTSYAGRALQWAAGWPDRPLNPDLVMAATSMASSRAFRREFLPPNKFTDEELRRIAAPTTVLIGDREVIYAGGPHAALERAQRLIPNVHTRLVADAGHVLTTDAPGAVVTELTVD
jgi:pimeloyl-ACP methyl ester carboxylesterase